MNASEEFKEFEGFAPMWEQILCRRDLAALPLVQNATRCGFQARIDT